jgi:hypothetical protein
MFDWKGGICPLAHRCYSPEDQHPHVTSVRTPKFTLPQWLQRSFDLILIYFLSHYLHSVVLRRPLLINAAADSASNHQPFSSECSEGRGTRIERLFLITGSLPNDRITWLYCRRRQTELAPSLWQAVWRLHHCYYCHRVVTTVREARQRR